MNEEIQMETHEYEFAKKDRKESLKPEKGERKRPKVDG
jgi:hypothetical protein